MQQNRDFKGIWIPKEIWLDPSMSMQEKVFLAEIDSLDREDGCFASNEYFAQFFGMSKNRCSKVISGLETKGKIRVILTKDGPNNDRRVIRGVLAKTTIPYGRKRQGGIGENANHITKVITKRRKNTLPAQKPAEEKPMAKVEKKVVKALKATKTEGGVINEIMALFEVVNPMSQKLFSNNTERLALDELVVKFGKEKIMGLVGSLARSNESTYAPTITKPTELIRDLGRLVAWYRKESVRKSRSAQGAEKELVGM